MDETGRFYVATKDHRRDGVRNAKKNPSVAVRIGNTKRAMRAIPLTSDADKDHVGSLYRNKYFIARVMGFLGRARPSNYGAFELKPQ